MEERGRWRELPGWVRRDAYATTVGLGKFTLFSTAIISLMLVVGRQPDLIPGMAAILGGAWFLAFLGLFFYWPWVFRSWQRRQLRKRGVVIPAPHEAPRRHQRFSAIVEMVVGFSILFLFGLAFIGAIEELVGGTAPERILAGILIVVTLVAVGVLLFWRGWRKWRHLAAVS